MAVANNLQPTIHFVGSIPLADSETVFRTLSASAGRYLKRWPDGETGIRKTWIKFLQDVLALNPAIEVASDVPPFKFVQWDGKLIREIPRLRLKPGARPDPTTFETGYADMAIASWGVFDRLQQDGSIPAGVKFQISLPTPIAPTYNNMVPSDRAGLLPALTRHFVGEVEKIAAALPNDRIAIQWDVCQEVLAWEGYYEQGPVDVRTETVDVLRKIGDAVPDAIDLGYHLCYGSPADEHMVQPKDAGIMAAIVGAGSGGRSSSSICRCQSPALMMRILLHWRRCGWGRRPSCIWVWCITMMMRAMRAGWRRLGGMCGLTGLRRNAAWLGATRHGCRSCWQPMLRRPAEGHDRLNAAPSTWAGRSSIFES
jgi:hypothetical protein